VVRDERETREGGTSDVEGRLGASWGRGNWSLSTGTAVQCTQLERIKSGRKGTAWGLINVVKRTSATAEKNRSEGNRGGDVLTKEKGDKPLGIPKREGTTLKRNGRHSLEGHDLGE